MMIGDWGHDSSDSVMAKLDSHVTPLLKYSSVHINGNARFPCQSSNGAAAFLNCSSDHRFYFFFNYYLIIFNLFLIYFNLF